jgi:hypothetical protein
LKLFQEWGQGGMKENGGGDEIFYIFEMFEIFDTL